MVSNYLLPNCFANVLEKDYLVVGHEPCMWMTPTGFEIQVVQGYTFFANIF